MSKAKAEPGVVTDDPAAVLTAAERRRPWLILPGDVVKKQWDTFLTTVLLEWLEDIDGLDEVPLEALFRLACRYDPRLTSKRGPGRPPDSHDKKTRKQVWRLARVAEYVHRKGCTVTDAEHAAASKEEPRDFEGPVIGYRTFSEARRKNKTLWDLMLKDPEVAASYLQAVRA